MGRSPGRRVGYAHPPAAGQSPAAGSQRGQGPAAPPPRRTGLPGGRRGAAAFCGSGALWAPDPQNQRRGRGPKAPRPLRCARCARLPPPLPPGFPPTPKRQQNPRPFNQPDHAPSTTRKKVIAPASRSEGVYNRAGEPSEPFSGEEPRRNERSPGKGTLPGPSGWSPRRRGQRRLHPLRRGLRAQGNRARCCATIAVRAGPRRARKIVHLTFFAASCTIGI